MSIAVGDPAPDFRLPSTSGAEVALRDFAGRHLVLVFYPADDSPVCTRQLNSYNDELGQFEALDAQIVAISSQGAESHQRFAEKHDLRFLLLSDNDKAVAASYGALGPLGFPRRSVFIIDRDGVVRYVHRAIAGLTFRPVSELVEVLARLDS